MLIPSCTQRSRKSGVVFPAHFFEVFSGFHLRLHIQAPQFDQLGQDLVDGEGVELVQELLRAVRHIRRVRMTGHQPHTTASGCHLPASDSHEQSHAVYSK